MLMVIAAVVVTLACAMLAWSSPRRAAMLVPPDAAALARQLDALPFDERAPRLARAAAQADWCRELAEELAGTSQDAARIVAIDEAVAQVEHQLSQGEGVATKAAWLTAAGCAMLAIAALASSRWEAALAILPVALGGVIACLAARRRGARQNARLRREIDVLVAALSRDLEEDPELPQRRRHRFRRRSL